MHPHHTGHQWVVFRHCALAQQSQRHGNLGFFGQLAQLVHRAGHQDAVPGQDDRSLRFADEFERGFDLIFLRLGGRTITGQTHFAFRVHKFDLLILDVFGNVNQHRPWTASPGDVERLTDGIGQFAGVGDQIVMLGDRERDAGHVDFLEGV